MELWQVILVKIEMENEEFQHILCYCTVTLSMLYSFAHEFVNLQLMPWVKRCPFPIFKLLPHSIKTATIRTCLSEMVCKYQSDSRKVGDHQETSASCCLVFLD